MSAPADFTIGEFVARLVATYAYETMEVYGEHCSPGLHWQPTGKLVASVLRRWPIATPFNRVPLLDCGCFDMNALEDGATPQRRWLGMGS